MLDLSNPYHAHIDRRLRTEPIIWLTTSSPTGRPRVMQSTGRVLFGLEPDTPLL